MGIRELRTKQSEALEAYHAEHARLENEIIAIREKRGTKLKSRITEIDSYLWSLAEGRAAPRRNGNW